MKSWTRDRAGSRRTLAMLIACASFVLTNASCKPTAELEACNIAHEECQLDIYYALMRMRGDGVDPFAGVPPIRTLTVDEYRAELDRSAPKPKPPSDDDDEPVEKPVDPWDVALQLLGFIEPKKPSSEQAVKDRVIRVAAFYSSATRTVTVIDRGNKRNDRGDTTLLLHELVHAVQDDEVDRWDGHSTDADFAVSAMIEGEAVMYEEMAGYEIRGIEPTEADWDKKFDNWLNARRHQMIDEPAPYYAANWFVYPLGGELFTDAYRRGGTAAVRHLLGSAPRHAVELMRNHDQTSGAEPGSLDCNAGPPDPRFRLAGYDRFGGVKIYGFLTRAGLDENEAWELALHLRDDQFFLFFDPMEQDVALAWRWRMGKDSQATQIAEALAGQEHFVVDAIDSDVVVRAANHDGLLDDWPASSSCL